ncbi:MAG0480 family ComEC-like protein [Metamycoplasma canadense]|uniref:ComEC/Rec2-related protein domain-containing protein n=1 Tax=Metamycoplasma canadense TaxID=29554 RepID=A0A077L4S6_9BACT|nr:hypothetical protein MCAN360_0025 [Metamycoplasma canadense]
MKWNFRNSWCWWKNLLNFSKKHRYIDFIFPSCLTSFLLVSLFLNIDNYLIIGLLILVFIFNFFNYKFWILSLIFFAIIFLSLSCYLIYFNYYNFYHIENNFKLEKNYDNFLLFKLKNINFIVWKNSKFKKLNININYETKYQYFFFLKGMLLKIKNPKLFNISNKILFELNLQEIKFLNKESTFKIFFSENKIIEEYINIIVLNKYEKNSLIYKKLVNLNIIHFFTISGFHFNLIYLTITKLIKKIKIKIPIDDFFAFSFLIIYLTILEFKISATRSLIFLLLIFLNKNIFNKKMNNINLLSITAVLLATLNPFAIYDYSFILSFLITLFIFITVYIFKNKNFYFKSIMVLIIAHLFSTLIIHTFNDKYNVFSFFNQVLLLPLISLNYIFTLIFFKWSIVSEKLILFFDTILNLLNEATYIVKFEISNFICIYFCSIFLILRKLKFYKSIKINQ